MDFNIEFWSLLIIGNIYLAVDNEMWIIWFILAIAVWILNLYCGYKELSQFPTNVKKKDKINT